MTAENSSGKPHFTTRRDTGSPKSIRSKILKRNIKTDTMKNWTA